MSGSANVNDTYIPVRNSINNTRSVFQVSLANVKDKTVRTKTGHLAFVKLDSGLTKDFASGPPFGNIPWSHVPSVLAAGSASHPVASDPGRISQALGLPTGSTDQKQAIPTQHFANQWLLQKETYEPADHPNVLPSVEALRPELICTGPFVIELSADPMGNAAMLIKVAIEYEAGVEFIESVTESEFRYTSANNGVVFLANTGHPWSVREITPMHVAMFSGAGGDSDQADRYVFINRGVLSVLYIGDQNGIVKNISSSSENAQGNLSNQYGYGSVNLGAERTFSKVWRTSTNGDDPVGDRSSYLDFKTSSQLGVYSSMEMLRDYLRICNFDGLYIFAKIIDSDSTIQTFPDTQPLFGNTLNLTPRVGGSVRVAIDTAAENVSGINAILLDKTFYDASLIEANTFSVGLFPNGLADYGVVNTTLATEVAADIPFAPDERRCVTYYLAERSKIEAAGGVLRNVTPIAVISFSLINNDTPTDRRMSFHVRVGNIWVDQDGMIEYPALRPISPHFDGAYNIKDFPSSGTPTSSSRYRPGGYVAEFPLGLYGSNQFVENVNDGIATSVLGVKRIGYDFDGTSEALAIVNFRAANTADNIKEPPSSGVKRLLFWEPILDHYTPPSAVTIAYPNGLKLVDFGVPVGSPNSSSESEYKYVRRVPSLHYGAADASVYNSVDENGDPIVTNNDAVELVQKFRSEFLDESTTNDSYMWKGTVLKPMDDMTHPSTRRRIHSNILQWGRKAYRYARYIEMLARGNRPPYTDSEYGNGNGAGISSAISEGAWKLWAGVRHAITDGFVPCYAPLRRAIDGEPTSYTGMDVVYAGCTGDWRSKLSVANNVPSVVDPLTSLLQLVGISEPAAAALRLNSGTYGGITTIDNLAAISGDDTEINKIVDLDSSNTGLDNHTRMTREFLDEAIRIARANSTILGSPENPNYRFVDLLSTFQEMRYDRSMCEDAPSARSVWGGMNHRFGHEMDQWGVLCDPVGNPISADADIPEPANVIQLSRLASSTVGTNPGNPNFAAFPDNTDFSYFGEHHHSIGYLLYATAVAMKYGAGVARTFEGLTETRTVAEDIEILLTVPSAVTCGAPEPYPLLQAMMDICAPPTAIARSGDTTGIVTPKGTGDRINRHYPPHRNFDVYTGHSWNKGSSYDINTSEFTSPPYIKLFEEASGEAIVGYLGAFRLVREFFRYVNNRRANSAVSVRSTQTFNTIISLLAPGADNLNSFPTAIYTMLCSEVAAANAFRPIRSINHLCDVARDQTFKTFDISLSAITLGNSNRGFPIVASKFLVNDHLHNYLSTASLLGSARSTRFQYDQVLFRNYPGTFMLQLGTQLVPLHDLSGLINKTRWRNVSSGFHVTRDGMEVLDQTHIRQFGGVLTTSSGGIPTGFNAGDIISIVEWIKEVYLGVEDDSTGPGGAPAVGTNYNTSDRVSRKIQQWARLVAAALLYHVGVKDTPGVPHPTLTAPQAGSIPYPKETGSGSAGGYLPQSSWYDVLFWLRANSRTPDPIPDVSNPFP